MTLCITQKGDSEPCAGACSLPRLRRRTDNTSCSTREMCRRLGDAIVTEKRVEEARQPETTFIESQGELMRIKSVHERLAELGCCDIFLHAVLPRLNAPRAATLLVPIDRAFHGEELTFEQSSCLLHIIPGPYSIADLSRAGLVLSAHPDPRHALRFRFNVRGCCDVHVHSDRPDPLLATVIYRDLVCDGGTIIHVVSAILCAPSAHID